MLRGSGRRGEGDGLQCAGGLCNAHRLRRDSNRTDERLSRSLVESRLRSIRRRTQCSRLRLLTWEVRCDGPFPRISAVRRGAAKDTALNSRRQDGC
jgi:hypothetical protein